MQNRSLFEALNEDLNLLKIEQCARGWMKEYPCIQRLELYNANYKIKREEGAKFVIACIVPDNPDLSEKDVFEQDYILYEYYKWVGDNSSWWHIEGDIPGFYRRNVELSGRDILREWRWVSVSPDDREYNLVGVYADTEEPYVILFEDQDQNDDENIDSTMECDRTESSQIGSTEDQDHEDDKLISTLEDALKNIASDIELFYSFVKVVSKEEKIQEGLYGIEMKHLVQAFEKGQQKFSFLTAEHIKGFTTISQCPRDIKAPIIKSMVRDLYPGIFTENKLANSQQKLFSHYNRVKK